MPAEGNAAMKAPEKIAEDVVEYWDDAEEGYGELTARIAAAIAAERAKADALAEALREIAEMTVDPKMQPAQWKVNCCNAVARTALAAYESDGGPVHG